MSSHHIVRDQQEPALIIANGESCSLELIGQLLEWSPTVVALDGAANRLREQGIKMDILIGDLDSVDGLEELEQEQQPIEVIRVKSQENTDLEKALDLLLERGYPAANILWATGWRADHTVNNLMSLFKYAGKMDLTILDDNSRIYPLKRQFKKRFDQGLTLSLLPFGTVEEVRTSGLKYNLNGEQLAAGVRTGSSNSVQGDGWVEISHNTGYLMLMECWD